MDDLLGGTFESLVQGTSAAAAEIPAGAARGGERPPGEGVSGNGRPGAGPARRREAPPIPAAPSSLPAGAEPAAPRLAARPSPERGAAAAAPARLLAVASGKGGTGKSILAVNVAVHLAARHRVALVDADLGLANAHILLGLLPPRDARDLLAGDRSLEEVLIEGPRGLLLLPGASGLPEMAALSDAQVEHLAVALAPLFAGREAVILDCPSGMTRQSLILLHGADLVAVVTTEDVTAMTDAYALIKTLLTHRPHAAVGLVVNEARSEAEGAEAYRKLSHVTRKFLGRDVVSLGTIPRDQLLPRSVAERRPLVLGHPASPAARALAEVAERLWALRTAAAHLTFPERIRRTLGGSPPAGDGDRPCAS
jgi:flagellar biosynthesis protein FlhG